VNIVEIPFGSVGVDCLSPVSVERAKELAAYVFPGTRTGIAFVERYLDNLAIDEIAGIHAAGLGVSPIAEARISGWNDIAGGTDGLRAATRARTLKLPIGQPLRLHLGCDLEGMTCSAADAMAYGEAWCSSPDAAGYAQLGYVGAGVPLTPGQLFSLPFTAYQRGLSNVQQVETCDYCMWQLFPTQTLLLASGPFQVDVDVVCRDKRGSPGRLPTMVIA